MSEKVAEQVRLKRTVALYNSIPNLFWSISCLTPISVYCYKSVPLTLLYSGIALSISSLALPISFFDRIQLGKSTTLYRKVGIMYINRFTQDGAIINRILRKKLSTYNVLRPASNSVRQRLEKTYLFEKFHFMMLLFFTAITIYALLKRDTIWVIALSVTNLIYNVYPNLLQQYIRIRLTNFSSRYVAKPVSRAQGNTGL